jgi:hypothetical protein
VANDDFVSFEKALRELKLRSEELKKLVSEGEIRAFRDGDSMKFRREDLVALSAKAEAEKELNFADALEDDTGMVTEQLSADDTLLAEEEPVPQKRPARSTRAAPVAVVVPGREPKWVTAAAILGFVALIWGFMICYSASQHSDPNGSMFTSLFAEKKAK